MACYRRLFLTTPGGVRNEEMPIATTLKKCSAHRNDMQHTYITRRRSTGPKATGGGGVSNADSSRVDHARTTRASYQVNHPDDVSLDRRRYRHRC